MKFIYILFALLLSNITHAAIRLDATISYRTYKKIAALRTAVIMEPMKEEVLFNERDDLALAVRVEPTQEMAKVCARIMEKHEYGLAEVSSPELHVRWGESAEIRLAQMDKEGNESDLYVTFSVHQE